MNTNELISILDKLNDSLNDVKIIKEEKKKKQLKNIQELKKEFLKVNVNKNLENVYKSLVKNGNKLIKEIKTTNDSKELTGKIDYYIRYLRAALADFSGNTSYIGKYYRIYIITSALFLALSPQYYGFILAVVFFVPIFLGIKGIRNRSKTGFHLSLTVIPVALMTSFTWLRYGIYAISNFKTALNETISSTGFSPSMSKFLVTVPPLFALLLLTCAIIMSYRAYKSKDLFI